MLSRIRIALSVVMGIAIAGCGGGGGGGGDHTQQDITVTLSPRTSSVAGGQTLLLTATILNPNNTGVTWALSGSGCTGSDCGTLGNYGGNNNQGWTATYTAPLTVPAQLSVTITATSKDDTTKSDRATLTITAPVVTVTVSPKTATVSPGGTQQFTATIAGSSNTAVTWTVSAGPGSVSDTGLYTAPAGVGTPASATVTATSQADNTKSDSATVNIVSPQALTISPTSATVAAGATQQFTANMPVTWSVAAAAGGAGQPVGAISSSGLFTAPLSPPWTGKVIVTATAQSDSSLTATATVTVTFSNASLQGHYVLRYRAADGNSGCSTTPGSPNCDYIYAVGSFVADGKGTITSGKVDLQLYSSAGHTTASGPVDLTGTYSVTADGRGSANFTVATTGNPSFPLRWVMLSNTAARMVGFDDTGSGWGSIDQQDTSAFASGIAGTFVFTYESLMWPAIYAGTGMFTASGGSVTSGHLDMNNNFASGPESHDVWQGSVSSVDPSTGRGTLTLVLDDGYNWPFVFYQIDASSFAITPGALSAFAAIGTGVKRDPNATFSNASLSGNVVFISTGYAGGYPVPASAAGLFTADGNGNLTNGVVDSIANGTGAVNAAAAGTYSIASNGRGTLDIVDAGNHNPLVIYMVAQNVCYYINQNVNVATGQFMPQASGPFTTSTLHGSLAFVLRETFTAPGVDVTGQVTADSAGGLTGKEDINDSGTPMPNANVTGAFTIGSNGRGQVNLTTGTWSVNYAMYLVSSRTAYLIPIDSGDATALGYLYRQF